jgi:hypothetical protein
MFKLKSASTSCLHLTCQRPSIFFLCLFADPFMYANMILVPKLSKCMFLTFDCVNFYPFISQVIKE